ncbi:sunset domain-containing protein [Limosilactobacillus caccae]|uniref:sunset domain-containing protein n=1 Tax=Limosilactobacillus caccae TaxID=1926284 RepID=UPI0009704FA4|nr:Ig-like domain-containing protein [Limosilactobacillus caccae]
MKKITTIFIGLIAGLCLWAVPNTQTVEASQTPLTINIPDGKQAQITNKAIKINSEADGTITFTGKTENDAKVSFVKYGGNNHHYKVIADENGNFSKTLKLAQNTKKCKFVITSDDDEDSKSAKVTFIVTNTGYVKPVESSSSSESSTAISEESSNATSSSETAVSTNDDMKTDQANGKIVGNINSKVYHTPDQQGYHMNPANAVYFNSEAEAQAAGYRKSLR